MNENNEGNPDKFVSNLIFEHQDNSLYNQDSFGALHTLVEELQQSLNNVKNYIHPLIQRLRSGPYRMPIESSGLETKTFLLIGYCIHIIFFLLIRTSGQTIKNHPLLIRLIQIRDYIDRTHLSNPKLKQVSNQPSQTFTNKNYTLKRKNSIENCSPVKSIPKQLALRKMSASTKSRLENQAFFSKNDNEGNDQRIQ